MLWFWIKYKILNLWLEVVGGFWFYRIGFSVERYVVNVISDEVNRDVSVGVYSDVGYYVESGYAGNF